MVRGSLVDNHIPLVSAGDWLLARDTRDCQLVVYRLHRYDYGFTMRYPYEYCYIFEGRFVFDRSSSFRTPPPPEILIAAYEYMAKTAEYAKGGRYDMTEYSDFRGT